MVKTILKSAFGFQFRCADRVAVAMLALVVLVATESNTIAQSEVDFPYQSLVVKNDAMVHSGPGKVHYGTEKLAAGDVVEVYRHDPGGWCAIRPVEGSFCIIPESTVEVIGEGVGKIKIDGTTPFVGTKLGAVEKPLWQVKLQADEKVALIGQLSWPNPEGHSTIWYQIKPPAGEFRWIHRSNLESLDAPLVAKSAAAIAAPAVVVASSPTVQSARRTPDQRQSVQRQLDQYQPDFVPQKPHSMVAFAAGTEDVKTPFAAEYQIQAVSHAAPVVSRQPVVTSDPPLQDSGSGWRKATRSISDESNFAAVTPATFTSSTNFGSQGIDEPNRLDGTSNSTLVSPSHVNFQPHTYAQAGYQTSIRIADASPAASRFADQLNQLRAAVVSPSLRTLNNQLTAEMLKDPSQWRLDSIEQSARQLAGHSAGGDLLEANQFLAKVANCRQIAAGYGGANQVNTSSANTTSSISTGDGSSQFDAVGWLNELKQAKGTAPSSYVLQDATGKITHQVSGIAGLNMGRYLKKKIGVVGERGFNQRLKLNHVSVSRVYPLY